MDKKEVGARIKKRRKELGMTQKDLASQILKAVVSVQQYERGVRYPDLATQALLTSALDCKYSDLFGDEIRIGVGGGLPPEELREWFDKKRKEAAEKQQQTPTPDQNELTPEEQKELDNYKKYLLWKRNQ